MSVRKWFTGDKPPKLDSGAVMVIGLGRFGGAVAKSLMALGVEVLAIDEHAELVATWSADVTHAVQADATDPETLTQLGVKDFDRAVVAIGNDIEASVLAVLALHELGVKDIWAKAINTRHGTILQRVGAHHIVYPELSMGQRVAHMIGAGMTDFLPFGDGYAVARTVAPDTICDVPLNESIVRTTYGVTVIAVKRPGEGFTYTENTTVIRAGDDLLISGSQNDVERFAAVAGAAPSPAPKPTNYHLR